MTNMHPRGAPQGAIARLLVAGTMVAVTMASVASPAAAASDGINQLIIVTQLKTDQANQTAMDGADRQRDLVGKKKQVRDAQHRFDSYVSGGGNVSSSIACRVCTRSR